MKKILCSLYAALICCLFVSCGPNPADVVERYLNDLKNNHYTEIPTYMHPSKTEWTEKEREEVIVFYETKVDERIKSKGGIQSYKIDSERVKSDGEKVVICYTINYGNGEKEMETCTVVKVGEEWMLSINK